MTRPLFCAAALALTVPVLALLPGAAASADTCAGVDRTETGVCVPEVADAAPSSTASINQAVAKHALVRRLAQLHARQLGPLAMHGALSADTETASPDSYQLSEVASMYIWKEGEGNGKKSYTCGPSATRNMVAAMFQRRDGNYKDYGEAQFATWEGTTTQGTSAANVKATLNNHFSSFGSWNTYRPVDKGAYLAIVSEDTYQYHQSVVKSLDTEFLGYYNNKKLDHFNFDYGYDLSQPDVTYISMADEWDPIFTYGSSDYGNPYGRHQVVLSHAYQSVINTSYHYMVN